MSTHVGGRYNNLAKIQFSYYYDRHYDNKIDQLLRKPNFVWVARV